MTPPEFQELSEKPNPASTTKFADFTPLGDDKPKAKT
jgi:hypothetical protein